MEDFQIYILQVNAGLVVFYLLYRMLFSRDTFLRIRRLFLFPSLYWLLYIPWFRWHPGWSKVMPCPGWLSGMPKCWRWLLLWLRNLPQNNRFSPGSGSWSGFGVGEVLCWHSVWRSSWLVSVDSLIRVKTELSSCSGHCFAEDYSSFLFLRLDFCQSGPLRRAGTSWDYRTRVCSCPPMAFIGYVTRGDTLYLFLVQSGCLAFT